MHPSCVTAPNRRKTADVTPRKLHVDSLKESDLFKPLQAQILDATLVGMWTKVRTTIPPSCISERLMETAKFHRILTG